MAGQDRYKEDTWYDAPTRKGKKRNEDLGSKGKGSVTKFFVSNLPEGCASVDLYGVLKGFGSIQGTYIARKYDKLGKRFGFVSFVNVKDPVELERDMKDVWIGSYKLFIVFARFVDGGRVSRNEEKKWVPLKEKDNGSRVPVDEVVQVDGGDQSGPSHVEGRSFRDTLVGKNNVDSVDELVVDDGFVGNALWKGWALVGVTKNLETLTALKRWLMSVRLSKVQIRYVGGLSVVLVFADKESMMDFLSTKEVWNPVFETLRIWEGQKCSSDRIAWC